MYARERIVGWGTFAALFTSAILLGAVSGNATLRAFSLIVGLGAGGACGVLAALFAHLFGRPASYQPIEGNDGAWGMMEYDDQVR